MELSIVAVVLLLLFIVITGSPVVILLPANIMHRFGEWRVEVGLGPLLLLLRWAFPIINRLRRSFCN